MNLNLIRERLDQERRTSARDGERIEVLRQVTRVAGDGGIWHMIAYSRVSADDADAVIAEQVAHYRGLRAEVEWKVFGHDGPADLLQRLSRVGFEIGGREAVMMLDLARRPTWLDQPSPYPVRRITEAREVEMYRQAAEEVFGEVNPLIEQELTRGLSTASTQLLGYVACDRERPVSIGRLYTHPDSAFGGLYGGGTVQSHRGRGLYRALVAARARDALELGARYLQVDALPTSWPILERLGFVRLTDTWPCALKAQATP